MTTGTDHGSGFAAEAPATGTAPVPSSLRMSAHAVVATELSARRNGAACTRVSTLRSEAPLVLRPTVRREPEPWAANRSGAARVCLSAGAAGPVGGDELTLDVQVGAGSTLVLGEISATLLLPGADGAASRTTVRVTVEAGGTLLWWPQPVIAAHACNHLTEVRIELATDARLVMREEILLGRHNEAPGLLRQRLSVRRDGLPVHLQDLELGSATGRSPAVLGDHRALGNILVVAPDPLPDTTILLDHQSLVMPLAAGSVLISALGQDNLEVRRRLSAGLKTLGPQFIPS
ncbi:MAG: urease accessory protein UreD [Intrasporangium sp.]|uniref:urease accessory protein UreD n=1 Tax=Intrasporangium sp. TaxID=1925024 RepID=UPI003F7FEF2F